MADLSSSRAMCGRELKAVQSRFHCLSIFWWSGNPGSIINVLVILCAKACKGRALQFSLLTPAVLMRLRLV